MRNCGKIHRKLKSEQFNGIQYIHSVVQPLHLSSSRTFHHPQGQPHIHGAFTSHSSVLPRPSQPAVSLLSLWICLFWTFRVNRIIQYMAFYDCLFEVHPSCTIYQFFIPFHGGIIFHCMHKPQILSPFNHWWTLGSSSPFHYCEQCCCEHCHLSICLNPFFSVLLGRILTSVWNYWVIW